jgi:hypothetical protein
MEMHLVHYKSSYGPNYNSAMVDKSNTWDTLAVLGVMFRIHNPNLKDVVEGHSLQPVFSNIFPVIS